MAMPPAHDDWLWGRPRSSSEPTQVLTGELVSRVPAAAERRFEAERYLARCHAARVEAQLLIEAGKIPDTGTPYDPHLEVIQGYFPAYANGRFDLAELFDKVEAETDRLQHNLSAALVGNEYAKLGFLAIDQPDCASPFADKAQYVLQTLGLIQSQIQLQLPLGGDVDAAP